MQPKTSQRPYLFRVLAGHPRSIGALLVALLAYPVLPHSLPASTRAVLAWDLGSLVLLALVSVMFMREGTDSLMAENAAQQEEGEWTVFWIVLAGVLFSFVALTQELANVKDLSPTVRGLHVGLVAATLFISWLVTHASFALRYAHEFYSVPGSPSATQGTAGGLQFPGEDKPDYWDFAYFSLVLGMTFQVSDVQITSRMLRRLAAVHGLIGFLFNTVIIALSVNIGASLLG